MEEAVLSVLQGGGKGDKDSDNGGIKVKNLRKMVLLSLQMDDDDNDDVDKSAKKDFKRTVKALEDAGKITLDANGLVSLKKTKGVNKKRKKKEQKKEESSSSSKRKRVEPEQEVDIDDGNQQQQQQQQQQQSSKDRNAPCKGNPQGVTRLFLGNLPFSVDEASLHAFFLPDSVVTHIRWITDKETGKFYGSAFIEMDNSESAANAVVNKSGQNLLGRPMKITFAPSLPGDVWPPPKKVVTGGATAAAGGGGTGSGSSTAVVGGGGGGQAGGKGIKAMSAKPDGCIKLFIGNLSYDIDDDAMKKFFGTVDAEVKALRWLHHKDSGDFKGCGYAEFWNTETCEKAATLNGKNILGRPIRIDWTD